MKIKNITKLTLTFLFSTVCLGTHAQGVKYLKLESKDQIGIVKSFKIFSEQKVTVTTTGNQIVSGKINFITQDSLKIGNEYFSFIDLKYISFARRRNKALALGGVVIGSASIIIGIRLRREVPSFYSDPIQRIDASLLIYTGITSITASGVMGTLKTRNIPLKHFNRTLVLR
ncbi:MAG: hypothetical protein COA58_09290 [Bacteroidetes bacterium]|nr:MAG: hypothetical protein COA58_09290 [Bacteroidota bacterium]